jgi:hypothetical protein
MIMNLELLRTWKDVAMAYLKVLSRCVIQEMGENHSKTSVTVASNLAEILTWYLPRTSLDHCHYLSLLGNSFMIFILILCHT